MRTGCPLCLCHGLAVYSGVQSMQGHEEADVEIRLKVWRGGVPAGMLIMLVNSCANRDIHNQIVGVCLVGQDITTQRIVMDR